MLLPLSVYAPEDACAGKNYPVMVWIHGGGYQFGNISQFDWTNFTQQANNGGKPVVVVSIQYRLGAQGFLAGEQVKENGLLNAGLLDQQFALQWVQQHIYDFGGDPCHVTIWGESAGGGSVMSQMLANGGDTVSALNLSAPLFEAIIGSSVFLPPQLAYNDPFAENGYTAMVDATGCSGSNDSFSCLTSVDELTFANASNAISAAAYFGYWDWVPVVDGTFLVDRPTQLIQQGKYNAKHVVDLHNTNEGYVFTNQALANEDANLSDSDLEAAFDGFLQGYLPHLDANARSAVAQQYPISSFPRVNNTFLRADAVSSESIFICPSLKLAQNVPGGDGYLGWYALNTSYHGQDIASYASPNLATVDSPTFIQSWIGELISSVLTYMPNNNPLNATINPYWPTVSQGQVLKFNVSSPGLDATADPMIVPLNTPLPPNLNGDLLANCDFWFGSISAQVPF